MGYVSKPVRNCLAIQERLLSAILDPETKTERLSGLATAYCAVEETIGALKFRPRAKPIDVTAVLRKDLRNMDKPALIELPVEQLLDELPVEQLLDPETGSSEQISTGSSEQISPDRKPRD